MQSGFFLIRIDNMQRIGLIPAAKLEIQGAGTLSPQSWLSKKSPVRIGLSSKMDHP